ncbi:hypothetical protein AAC691_15420 [Nguyenibacter vanlangensis]|uniref:Uncharacterized protein n=1 Tax=Nguyenibacter vanlangensis TaxID=1216886 RepID=A0ABZ3D1Z1_9PROT
MIVKISISFAYRGHIVECTRNDARIYRDGTEVAVSYAPYRAGIERAIDALIESAAT